MSPPMDSVRGGIFWGDDVCAGLRHGREIDRMIDIVTRINLEHGLLLSVYPLSESDLLNLQSPLLMNIRKEGVAA